MVQPWLEAGYRAVTVDLNDPPGLNENRSHLVQDVINLQSDFAKGAICVFAFPPCTDLAISGARWFKDKGLSALIRNLQIVDACREICEASGAPWMLENPIGTLATYWRDPDFSFDPCDYGDPYTKRTCIWCGGGFVMPTKVAQGDMFSEATIVDPVQGSLIYKMPDSNGRKELRSETPMGFARAVFKANRK